MGFRMADTFTDSLACWTGDGQKAVKTTAYGGEKGTFQILRFGLKLLLIHSSSARTELRQENIFSRRLEEDTDGHADFYAVKRCADDVADHVRVFGQFDDRDDVGSFSGPAAYCKKVLFS